MAIKDKLTINIDGGARGNPGASGIGIVFSGTDGRKNGYYYYTGHSTNNEAEYAALLKALKLASSKKHENIEIFTDSELLCNQIKGIYKVKSGNLVPLYGEAVKLLKNFKTYKIAHVPREKNKEADKLANKAIDLKSDGEIELAVAPRG